MTEMHDNRHIADLICMQDVIIVLHYNANCKTTTSISNLSIQWTYLKRIYGLNFILLNVIGYRC